MILDFENRSFHQDRPQKFRLKYLNIASKRAQREKRFTLAKPFSTFENRHFASHRPPCCRKKFVLQYRPQEVMPKNATM